MVFSSVLFLFLFLPLVLALYYLLVVPAQLAGRRVGVRLGNLFLLLASLVFYAWGEQWFVLVMVGSILLDYGCGLAISGAMKDRSSPVQLLEREGPRSRGQKFALFLSVAGNLSVFGFFKYFNFGIENINAVAEALDLQWLVSEEVMQITLPLGISFYTFQSLSYTIDVYRGDAKASRNLLDFACFVTLFPQLVAGPIVRYRDIALQLSDRIVTRSDFAAGVMRFVLGLGKKVLVANTVAIAADDIFAISEAHMTPGLAWLGVLCYTLQIYFDFSAYSDMAIGLGRMFGFHLLENFNYPYIACSVQEFWRRWHMSLSTWFRDYLYIPLGGNRGSSGRTYFNLFAVFFLCGLWHGASWTFVAWGMLHGAFLVFERLGLGRALNSCPRLLRHAYTLLVVMVGWVLFRAETFTEASVFLRAMAGSAQGAGDLYSVALVLNRELVWTLALALLFCMPVLPAVVRKYRQLTGEQGSALLLIGGQLIRVSIMGIIFAACAVSLAAGTHNPFIYFRF